jgi:hypothetical protein
MATTRWNSPEARAERAASEATEDKAKQVVLAEAEARAVVGVPRTPSATDRDLQ